MYFPDNFIYLVEISQIGPVLEAADLNRDVFLAHGKGFTQAKLLQYMWINRICAELFLESRGKGRKLRRKRRGMERGERARTRTLCICIFLVAYEDLISLLLRFEVMIEHWKIGLNTKIIQLCQKNLGMFKDRQRPICQPITHPRELSTKPAPYLSLNFLLLLCLLS